MRVYSVCPDELAPCLFNKIDDVMNDIKSHLENDCSAVSVFCFDMTEDEFASLPEHQGY